MAYITPDPKKILTLLKGRCHRFYPYPDENKTPKGIHPVVRFAPGFGFIIKDCKAIYGNNQSGAFTLARS